MEVKITAFIKLRKTVERTEHECNNCKGNRYPADSCKFKHAYLIRVFLKKNEHKINRCDQAAKDICQHRVELEVLYAR